MTNRNNDYDFGIPVCIHTVWEILVISQHAYAYADMGKGIKDVSF